MGRFAAILLTLLLLLPGIAAAGRTSSVGDASGSRNLAYTNSRLEQSEWTSGALRGYRVVRVYDGGVFSGVQLFKDGSATPVHEISYVHTGASDEISGVVASGFAADIFRREEGAPVDRPDRAIMKITRGTVDQLWKRGTAGRIVEASSDVAGAPSFDYVPGSATEANCFDGRGRRLKCTTGGGTWTYAYGTAGQLTSAVRDPASGTFNYNFDGIGRRSGGTDSLNQFTSAVHTTAKKLQVSVAPGASLFVNGQSKTLVDGKYTHVFPAPGATGVWEPWHVLGVLPGEGEQGAGPDAKAEQRGYVWTPPSTESFQYDGDGNRRSSSQWDYGWDALNRLVRARTKNYAGSPEGWDLAFSYDSEGRRFKKTVKHKTRNAANQPVETYKEVLFVWDGWDLIYERHDDGLRNQLLLERKYVWGPDIGGAPFCAGGAGGLLLMRETKRGGTSTDYYPLYDGSGHVTALATAGGTLAASYAYGPFGEQISATGPMAHANPWRFATKYYDTETGLYYFGHRYYDASSGQWLSREPLGESASLNLYAYCHNDPVNRVDMLGLSELSPDAPTTAQIEKQLTDLFKLVELNEKWLKEEQARPYESISDFFISFLAGDDGLNTQMQIHDQKQKIQFLGAILAIRGELGKNDYGTDKAWSVARSHFPDPIMGYPYELPEGVATYWLKPADLLPDNNSYRYRSRILDFMGQVEAEVFAATLPLGAIKSTMMARVEAPQLIVGASDDIGRAALPSMESLGAAANRVDKSWKLKIHGSAQKTGTPGHQFRAYREAIAEAKNPNVSAVHLDHGYNRALGLGPKTISPNRRPDVLSIYNDGTIRRFEVQSRTDVPAVLRSRNFELDQQLIDQGFTPTPPVIVRPY